MARVKFFVQTYYQLPQSKHLWDSVWRLPFLIKKMFAAKPKHVQVTDLEHSISVLKIDVFQVPNYADIYKEYTIWNWDTVKPPKLRRCYIHADGAPVTAQEIDQWIAEHSKL